MMDRAHEDFRLLLYAKAMSTKYITVGNKLINVISIKDALKFIGA